MVAITKTEVFSTSQLEQQPLVEYQIVHQNERRIRLSMPRLVDTVYADRLKFLVESLDYVSNVRINRAAKSIAIEFDCKVDVEKIATARQQVFAAIEQAQNLEIEESIAPLQEINYWQRIGLPVTTLGVALLASPLEVSIPFFVIGGLMVGAAVPIFQRAIAGIVDEGKCKVDVLDSLWITLQTLQGEYVAPALMLSLLETGEAVRDTTASTNKHETLELLHFSDCYASVASNGNYAALAQYLRTPIAHTQVGDYVKEVSDKLVVPTLFLSGSIFALTGNITGALAPLQLDFGTGIEIALPTTILAALTLLARRGVFVRNGKVLEVLARTDTIVFENTGTLTSATELQQQGLEVYVSDAARGMPEGHRLLAAQEVRRLRNQGKTVVYVGAETTDADVSVSFVKETDIQGKTDVAIVGNDLQTLIFAYNIAKQAMEIVYQNIALVAVPNISVVLAGVLLGLHPVAAVLINNCAALLAEMRGREFLSFERSEPSNKLLQGGHGGL